MTELLNELTALQIEFSRSRSELLRPEFEKIENLLSNAVSMDILIPNELMCLVSLSDRVNRVDGLFSGYEIFNISQFFDEYTNHTEPLNFFCQLGDANNWLYAAQDVEFYQKEGVDEFNRISVSRDLWSLCPVAKEKTDYLVFQINPECHHPIYDLELGFSAIQYAPSVYEHLDYLIAGIRSEKIELDDLGLVFPTHWNDRHEL